VQRFGSLRSRARIARVRAWFLVVCVSGLVASSALAKPPSVDAARHAAKSYLESDRRSSNVDVRVCWRVLHGQVKCHVTLDFEPKQTDPPRIYHEALRVWVRSHGGHLQCTIAPRVYWASCKTGKWEQTTAKRAQAH
jgi:hypothetical protein